MPWRYGKETVKAHSFQVAIPYLCHMCSYELKGAFYFGKIFWGLSSPMPGARSQTPTPPFRVIIWQLYSWLRLLILWRQNLNCAYLYIQKQQRFAALV